MNNMGFKNSLTFTLRGVGDCVGIQKISDAPGRIRPFALPGYMLLQAGQCVF